MGFFSSKSKSSVSNLTDIDTTTAGAEGGSIAAGGNIEFIDPGAIGLASESLKFGADVVSKLADVSGRAVESFDKANRASLAFAESTAKQPTQQLTENVFKFGVIGLVGIAIVVVFATRRTSKPK